MVNLRISLAVLGIILLAQTSFAEKVYDNIYDELPKNFYKLPPNANFRYTHEGKAPSITFRDAYYQIFPKLINIKPATLYPDLNRKIDQQSTGLDLSSILKLSGQQKDFKDFTTDHRYFQRDIDLLVKAKKSWALCALLNHKNVDAKIYAARGLLKLSDPMTAPVILAAARQNNYDVSGSENATLHSIYRRTLKQALEKISGQNLTPAGLTLTRSADGKQLEIKSEDKPESFPEHIDIKKTQQWLMSAAHILFKLADLQDKATGLNAAIWGTQDTTSILKHITAVIAATAKDHGKIIERSTSHDGVIMEGVGSMAMYYRYTKYKQTFNISEVIAGKQNNKEIALTYTISERNPLPGGMFAKSPFLPNVKMLLFLGAKGKLFKVTVDTPIVRQRAIALYERKVKK